ncbi:putative EamA domain-containing protein [Tanacetum coccineum]
MGVEERGKLFYKDVLPFAAMIMIELMLVGGNTLFKSASVEGINSYVFTFYVFLLGFIFLLPCLIIHYRRTSIPPIKFSWENSYAYLSQIFGYIGLKYSSPTLSSIMSNLSPAFTFVLAYFFRMERIHFRSYTSQAKIIGTIVSISGAVIATLYSGPSLLSSNISMNWIVGGVLLASQYFLLAFALVAQAKILQVYSVDLMVVFVFGLSGLFVAGFAALVMANDVEAWKLKSNAVLITVLYMILGISLERPPVYVAMFKPLTIVIAVIMGVLFLGDSLHLGSVIGGTIITIGFYGVVWGKAEEEHALLDQTTPLLPGPHDVLEQGSVISEVTSLS